MEVSLDTAALFNVVFGLLGCKADNPTPEREPQLLASEFANFFITKILKIQNELATHPIFKLEVVNMDSVLSEFDPVTDEDVRCIVS